MTPQTNQTVREIAIHCPGTVRVFESLGIDYCCGGKRSLEEACERAHVPVGKALELLAQVEAEPVSPEEAQWAQASFADLTAHIVSRHHAYLRSEAPRLEQLLNKVATKHGGAHPELHQIHSIFTAMSQELFAHLFKEEQVLFPYLEQMEAAKLSGTAAPSSSFGPVEMPIARMLADHDDAGALTARIRELSGNFAVPDGACPSYRGLYHGLEEFERDLHRHVHLENNILFPRALEMARRQAEHVHP